MLRSLAPLRGLAALALLAATGTACLGGFDLEAGDVAVFRVGYSEVNLADGCYEGDQIPEDDGDSTNLRSGQTVLVYAAAAEDAEPVYYLDTGSLVLEGAAGEDGVFSFTGQTKDVSSIGGNTITDVDHDGQDDYNGDQLIDADGDGLSDNNDDDFVDADGDTLDDRFEDDYVDSNNDGVDDRQPITLPSDTKLVQTIKYAVSMNVTDEGVSGTFEQVSAVKCDGPNCATFPGTECQATTNFVGVWVEDASVDVSLSGGNPNPGND
jgi:hypothetical protein